MHLLAPDILVVRGLSRSFGGLKAVDQVDFGIPRGGVRASVTLPV